MTDARPTRAEIESLIARAPAYSLNVFAADAWRDEAVAILHRLASPAPAQAAVPREPTQEMMLAGLDVQEAEDGQDTAGVWRAMWDAAPQPPARESDDADLCTRLNAASSDERLSTGMLYREAADRIDALAAEVEYWKRLSGRCGDDNVAISKLRDKAEAECAALRKLLMLAKEALGDWEDGTDEQHTHYCPNCDNSIDSGRWLRQQIDVALAEKATK